MFERAVVHVGLHKTGTSTIQTTLLQNASSLEEHERIYFPRLAANHSVFVYPMFCDEPHRYAPVARTGATTPLAAERRNDRMRRKFEADFAKTSAQTLLLSGEDIALLNEAGLQRLKTWLTGHAERIDILIYVRDPVAWAASAAQQRIKGGATLATIADSPPNENIGKRIRLFQTVFGADAVIVRSFEAAISSGLFADFCQTVGIDRTWVNTVRVETRNESMSREAVHLISVLNETHPLPNKARIAPGRMQGDIRAFSRLQGGKFRLPVALSQEIANRAAADLLWLKDTFGIDYTGQSSSQTSEHTDDDTLADMIPVEFAADAVSAVVTQGAIREMELRAQIALMEDAPEKAQSIIRDMRIVDPGNPGIERVRRALRKSRQAARKSGT